MVRARAVCGRIILACAAVSCGGDVHGETARDASVAEPDDTGALQPDPPFEFGDAADAHAPSDSGVPVPPLDAGDPPARACADGGDGGDAGACPFPASVCADRNWLVYYTGGACVDGYCVWEKKFLYCGGNCMNGACRIAGTPPVPR